MGIEEVDIDVAQLESYLSNELGSPVADIDLIQDGVNLTLAISTREQPTAYILQRPNLVRRETDYFTELGQEYRVLQTLRDTALDAPQPVVFCDDASIIGDSFSVVTRIEGTSIPWGGDLPERYRTEDARDQVADRFIETLAGIQMLAGDSFDGVCSRMTAADQVSRSIDRLDRATGVTGRDLPTLRTVADWLQANAPADSEITLVHGDYKPDNVLFADTEQPQIAGVIDWETAKLGDPLIDLGFFLLFWRDAGDPTPSVTALEETYPDHPSLDQLRAVNETGFWPFTSRPGSPTRRELVARYERHTELSLENERFYRALPPFIIATAWEAFDSHLIEAEAESAHEPMVEYMSRLADSIVSGEFRL